VSVQLVELFGQENEGPDPRLFVLSATGRPPGLAQACFSSFYHLFNDN
jgi:hypothetical protein